MKCYSSIFITEFLQVVSTVKYFQQHMGKPFLIGRKHMIAWPHLLTSLQQMNVKYFFIDDM